MKKKNVLLLFDNRPDMVRYRSLIQEPPQQVEINEGVYRLITNKPAYEINEEIWPFSAVGFYNPKKALKHIEKKAVFAAMVQYNYGERHLLRQKDGSFFKKIKDEYLPRFEQPRGTPVQALEYMVDFAEKAKKISPDLKLIATGLPVEKRALVQYLLQGQPDLYINRPPNFDWVLGENPDDRDKLFQHLFFALHILKNPRDPKKPPFYI